MYWSVNDTKCHFPLRFALGNRKTQSACMSNEIGDWSNVSSGNNRAGRCHGKIFQGKANNKCWRRKEEGGKWRKQVKADRCCQTRAVWLVEINAGPTCNLFGYFFGKKKKNIKISTTHREEGEINKWKMENTVRIDVHERDTPLSFISETTPVVVDGHVFVSPRHQAKWTWAATVTYFNAVCSLDAFDRKSSHNGAPTCKFFNN